MFKEVVELLEKKNLHIATMESCTGGALASAITSVTGASEVLQFSAVTYSNEYKIKMGVSADVIEKYSVYSMETANEMSIHISQFANSDIGVGITGKINAADAKNPEGQDNLVYISIYFKRENSYKNFTYEAVPGETREWNKQQIVKLIEKNLQTLLRDLSF